MCILIAEDEPIILMRVELCLEDAGHVVMAVQHGQEAIDSIEAHPGKFSCLITAFRMPDGMAGVYIIERMRRSYPAIPMIVVTESPDAIGAAWRSKLGVHVVPKPYDPDDLVGTVQRLLAA